MVSFNVGLLTVALLLAGIAASQQPTSGSPIAVTIVKADSAHSQANKNGVVSPVKRHQQRVRRAIQRLQARESTLNLSGGRRSGQIPRAVLPIELHAEDSYLGVIRLGTPPRDFQMVIDSGSADFWVPSDNCTTDWLLNSIGEIIGIASPKKCGNQQTLGKSTSSTFRTSLIPSSWAIFYGANEVYGVFATDVVSIAGLALNHTFGVALKEDESYAEAAYFDGICGLAKQQLSTQLTPTILNALYSLKLIPAPIVSYKLPRSADSTTPGVGEITFGALNPASYDASTAVVVPNNDHSGYWGVKLDRFTIGGQSLQTRYQNGILDISTHGTIVSDRDARVINNLLNATYDNQNDVWQAPCNINTTISLAIGGLEVTLQPGDIVEDVGLGNGNCISLFSGFGFVGFGPDAIIGDNILRNLYFSTNEATNKITIARPT